MYLQTANPRRAFIERPGADSALHDAFSGFRSAEDRVYEGDFQSVLKVLAGPSPWQQYILPNLAIAKKHLPRKPFSIVSLREFTDLMSNLGRSGTERTIPGFTDKRTGTITMQEWGVNTKATFLGAALHETVHLVSHPAEQGKPSTAWGPLGEGLLEGLVECVTLDILKEQKIALAGPKLRGHVHRVPVAVALLRNLSIPLMARVLFGGDSRQFEAVVHHTYSVIGWHQIMDMTTANPTRAIQLMNDWRAKQEQVHRIRLQQQMMNIPGRRP